MEYQNMRAYDPMYPLVENDIFGSRMMHRLVTGQYGLALLEIARMTDRNRSREFGAT